MCTAAALDARLDGIIYFLCVYVCCDENVTENVLWRFLGEYFLFLHLVPSTEIYIQLLTFISPF